jgi:uncharacterized protein
MKKLIRRVLCVVVIMCYLHTCSNGMGWGDDVPLLRRSLNSRLLVASCDGDSDGVQVLLEEKADQNSKSCQQYWTALMFASWRGYAKVIQALLEAGADVNARTNANQWTALMIASRFGQIEVVRMLIDAGADMTLKDVNGDTAADLAQLHGYDEVAQLLKDILETKNALPTITSAEWIDCSFDVLCDYVMPFVD